MTKAVLIPFLAMNLVLVPGFPLEAQTENAPVIYFLEHPDSMPPATLEQVSWLVGHWRGSILGAPAEMVWAPAQGESMMGMFRLIPEGSVSFYEFIILVEEQGSLRLKLKHFHPSLIGWEDREGMEVLPLVKVTPEAAYFDGLTYRRVDDQTLTGSLMVEVAEGERTVGFTYHRVGPSTGPSGGGKGGPGRAGTWEPESDQQIQEEF